jgi:hypothetical protein
MLLATGPHLLGEAIRSRTADIRQDEGHFMTEIPLKGDGQAEIGRKAGYPVRTTTRTV